MKKATESWQKLNMLKQMRICKGFFIKVLCLSKRALMKKYNYSVVSGPDLRILIIGSRFGHACYFADEFRRSAKFLKIF